MKEMRLVRKDPVTREIIEELVSCRLAKSCMKCPMEKLGYCQYAYKGARREAKAINDSRLELIRELDKRGWTIYGIRELIRVSEGLVKKALE